MAVTALAKFVGRGLALWIVMGVVVVLVVLVVVLCLLAAGDAVRVVARGSSR